jgi:peptidoglycan hydrolase CwlO-like protein
MANKETVKKEENVVEVELTPEQQNFQTHIQSLTRKINQHQFEIDELMPSLNMYKQALTKSIKPKDVPEEEKND